MRIRNSWCAILVVLVVVGQASAQDENEFRRVTRILAAQMPETLKDDMQQKLIATGKTSAEADRIIAQAIDRYSKCIVNVALDQGRSQGFTDAVILDALTGRVRSNDPDQNFRNFDFVSWKNKSLSCRKELSADLELEILESLVLTEELPDRLTADDHIDGQAELRSLGSMDGIWVGMVRPIYDPVGNNREYPGGYPIRIEVDGENTGLWMIEAGDVLDPFPGDTVLIFSADGTTLIDYVVGNEMFNEVWSISLNHVGPDKMMGFVSRTVHNFAVRRDSPWRVFPVYSVVEFERVK